MRCWWAEGTWPACHVRPQCSDCSGVAVAWRSVGAQCSGVQLASVVRRVEVGKREEKKKKGRRQEPRQAGEVRSGQAGYGRCV